MNNELKIGDKYFTGMLKLSQVPNWNPLYEFLKHIFGDKYKEAANGFMFMGAYRYEDIGIDFYIYKHGITRKSFVLDEDGEPYELDYKLIKYKDSEFSSGYNYDHFVQGASKMSYSDMYNYIYQDIVKMVNKACEENNCKIPNDQFMMKYSDYAILRDKLLKKHGINVISVNKDDDFKNLKMENNKTKNRLYEMFERVCGVRLINESEENKIDFGVLVKGYIKGSMELISSLVRSDDIKKQSSSSDDKQGNYATIDKDSDIDNNNEFSTEIALDNARTLVNDFNRVGLDRFVSEYVDEDSLINIYKDIRLIFDNINDEYNNMVINKKIDLLKLGELIFFSRNGDTKDSVKFGLVLLINEIIDELNIKPVDFSVSKGKLIFFDNGKGILV